MTHPSKGIAALIAAQGRNGDDELIHVNKQELAALERLGDHVGIKTTTNPHTGLKEAFNWGSTIGGVLGGIGGTFAAPFTGGIINPYTGAALGSAAGTKLSGGSNDEALMNGAIAGVTAWGLGGASDALGSLGQEATKEATGEVVKTGVQEGVANTLPAAAPTTSVLPTAPITTTAPVTPPALPQGVEAFAKPSVDIMPDPGYYGVGNVGPQGANTYTAQGTKELMAGTPNAVPGSITSVPPGEGFKTQAMNPDYWSGVGRGIEALNTPGKVGEFAMANKGSLLAGGLGAYGMAIQEPSNPDYSDTGTTGYAGPSYRGEVYYTPYGERRTRAVPYARGGDVYGDYDGVDENADGGYIPGGGLNFAAGGISDLGHYSDGGQLLRGAGDGVSDSIPASIAGKRPARLADGEFVVPARAVSELGNGSTEAGAKQLYGMLDRISKKRKKGNGLAYQANPKKLMPA